MSASRHGQPRVIGVLLAAGRGRRMGTAKQLLPWPADSTPGTVRTTVVAAAFDAIAGHCDQMIVVLGHEAQDVVAALGSRAFIRVQADADAEMLQSIKSGLEVARQMSARAALLQPGDHPGVRPQTVQTLLSLHASHPDVAVMPQYQGKGGHPALIPASLFQLILTYNGAGGLRQLWIDHPHLCMRIDVGDPMVVVDLDRPEDYEARFSG